MVEVVAALLVRGERFLACQRPAHKARGLLWEFVGGKVETGESPEQALRRECREELGVRLDVGPEFFQVRHVYPDIEVHLRLFRALLDDCEPQRLEHNALRWLRPEEIDGFAFCPADEAILARLKQGLPQGPGSGLPQTERLALREMTEADLPALRRILQDPAVMTAYEGPFSEAETRAWLEKQRRRYEETGCGLWAVTLRGTGEMIGQCGLTRQDIGAAEPVWEVGYLFQRAFWHRGYATEAARACRDWAFSALRLPRLYSIIRDNNLPSQAVARRNGMAVVDRFVKHYRGVEMPHLLFAVDAPPRA